MSRSPKHESGALVTVKVTPRSSRDAIEGSSGDGVLRIRVTAAPADGAANRSVVKLLATALRVPKSSITIVTGATSRTKRIHVDGVAPGDVEACWPSLDSPDRSGRRA